MLNAERVFKVFGDRIVLRDVSFTAAAGTITLVLGANGAGKTTLMRLLAGLDTPTEGTITQRCAPDKRGFLGHGTFVYPGLTALENLCFWLTLYGHEANAQRACDVLRRFDLSHVADDCASTFSRGMLQRLNLARLMAPEPDLILLDEPATGLDTASRGLLHSELAAARARGATVVWVSHEPERDAALADVLVRIEKSTLCLLHTPSRAQPPSHATPCTSQPITQALADSPTAQALAYSPTTQALADSPTTQALAEQNTVLLTTLACKQARTAPLLAPPPPPLSPVLSASLTPPPPPPAFPTLAPPSLLYAALTIARKDMRLVLRGLGLVHAVLLGLLLIFVFSLSRGPNDPMTGQGAAAIFWMASVFCLTLTSTAVYSLEDSNNSRAALRLMPCRVQAVWLGKALTCLMILLIAQILFVPAMAVFLGQSVTTHLALALVFCLLVDLGMVALGSLLGSLTSGGSHAGRESLLSVVLLPLMIPLLLAGVRIVGLLFDSALPVPSGIPVNMLDWIGLVLAFDSVFLAAGLVLFPYSFSD